MPQVTDFRTGGLMLLSGGTGALLASLMMTIASGSPTLAG